MDLMLIIYFADVVKGISDFFEIFFGISFSALVILGLFFFITTGKVPNQMKKILKVFAFVWPVCLFLALFVPSKDAIYLMAGAHFVEKALESRTGQKVVRLIEFEIDKRIQQMGGE